MTSSSACRRPDACTTTTRLPIFVHTRPSAYLGHAEPGAEFALPTDCQQPRVLLVRAKLRTDWCGARGGHRISGHSPRRAKIRISPPHITGSPSRFAGQGYGGRASRDGCHRGVEGQLPIISGLAAEIAGSSGDFAGAQTIYVTRCNAFRSPTFRSMAAEREATPASSTSRHCVSDGQLQITGLQAVWLAGEDLLSAMGQATTAAALAGRVLLPSGAVGPGHRATSVCAAGYRRRNLYEQSVVDARLRELRQLQAEEDKWKRDGG